jgi:hypothetical protein
MKETEDIRRELESRKGTERELEGFSPVKGRVRPGPRAVVSIRLSSEEFGEITDAAAVLGRNVSEFIRDAALKDARVIHAGVEAARTHASTS